MIGHPRFQRGRTLHRTALSIILLATIALGLYEWRDSLIIRRSPIGGAAGVILHDRWRAQPGINVIINGSHDGCLIQTLEGKTLAELPGGFCLFLPNGEYFSVGDAVNLYDREFKPRWSRTDLVQHHEAVYDPGRDIIWLVTWDFEGQGSALTAYDQIVGLERATGQTKYLWKVKDNLQRLRQLTDRECDRNYDEGQDFWQFSHLNTIDIGKEGELLVTDTGCFATFFALNPETGILSWSWPKSRSGTFPSDGIHAARYIRDGEILMLLNKVEDGFSEVRLVKADSGEASWQYRAAVSGAFFSKFFGGVSKLENGNYLVTHISKGGAAFELTPQGRIVWEWNNEILNPYGERETVYRLWRVEPSRIEPYLKAWAKVVGGGT